MEKLTTYFCEGIRLMNKIIIILSFCFLIVACENKNSRSNHEDHGQAKAKIESFYTCPMHPQIKQDEAGKCPICHMNLVKVEIDNSAMNDEKTSTPPKKQWQCKDYPEVISDKEDVCPIDGTPMIAVSHSMAGKEVARVNIRGAQLEHFRPTFFSVSPMRMRKEIRLLGSVLPSEEKESNIPARIPGRVEKVYVESTGAYIEEGVPVLDLYSPQLITGGEEYLLARKNYEKNRSKSFKDLLRKSEERLRLWGIKDWQMKEWYKEGTIPRSITIYSPSTGIVQARNASVGRYFKEGENFFELSELSSVWVQMDVYEQDAGLVETGQKVRMEFTALPGSKVEGEIDFISPVLNPKSRTLNVRTTIKNPSARLKPGMVADAILEVKIEGEPLVVPRSAIIDTGKRKVVWLKSSERSFKAIQITTGFESEGYVAVLEGLSSGDEVVLQGNFLLDAQAQLFGDYGKSQDSGHQH